MLRTIAILACSFAPVLAVASTYVLPGSTSALQTPGPPLVSVASDTSPGSRQRRSKRPVSTGAIPPRLIGSAKIHSFVKGNMVTANDRKIEIHMVVDRTGTPTEVEVTPSTDPTLDLLVEDAVRRFRYSPGTLDGEPTEVPVRLLVVVPHGTVY